MDNLIDFHARYGYNIRVQPLKTGSGCFVEYPKTSTKSPFIVAYIVDENEIKVTIDMEDREIPMKIIKAPRYATRVLIAMDLAFTSNKIGINKSLLSYYVEHKQATINEAINIKLSKDEEEKELAFTKAVLKIVSDEEISQFIEDNNIVDGYNAYNDMILTGGFCNV